MEILHKASPHSIAVIAWNIMWDFGNGLSQGKSKIWFPQEIDGKLIQMHEMHIEGLNLILACFPKGLELVEDLCIL